MCIGLNRLSILMKIRNSSVFRKYRGSFDITLNWNLFFLSINIFGLSMVCLFLILFCIYVSSLQCLQFFILSLLFCKLLLAETNKNLTNTFFSFIFLAKKNHSLNQKILVYKNHWWNENHKIALVPPLWKYGLSWKL